MNNKAESGDATVYPRGSPTPPFPLTSPSAMEIHERPSPEVVASLKSSPVGLNGAEAEEVGRKPLWLRLLEEFTQFFSVILVGGAFSFWQAYRVERTLDALRASPHL